MYNCHKNLVGASYVVIAVAVGIVQRNRRARVNGYGKICRPRGARYYPERDENGENPRYFSKTHLQSPHLASLVFKKYHQIFTAFGKPKAEHFWRYISNPHSRFLLLFF
jgi:hypothetical protein